MRTRTLSVLMCLMVLMSVPCLAQSPAPADAKVTLELNEMNVKTALDALFRDRGLNYSIAADVDANIDSLTLNDVTFDEALRSVCKAGGLTYRLSDGVYIIGNQAPEGNWGKIVNVEFKQTNLADAIETLLKDSGINYTISEDVRGLTVSAVLRNVTLDEALKAITKAAGVVFRGSAGMISISAKPMVAPGPAAPYAPDSGRPPLATRMPHPGDPGPRETKIITLKFLNPGDIAPLFWGQPGAQVVAASGGKLIISGAKEEVQRMLDVIASLDSESALARPIRLTVDVQVSANGTNRQNLNTMSIGAEGSPVLLDIGSELAKEKYPGQNYGTVQYDRRPSLLNLALTPSADSAGRISVTGGGRFEMVFPISGETANEFHRIAKEIQVGASLEPGKSQSIASGTVDTPAGRAAFDVQLTATIEKGRVPVVPQAPKPQGGYGGGRYGGPAGQPGASRGW